MGIALPYGRDHRESRLPYQVKPLVSGEVRVCLGEINGGGNVNGLVDVDVKISKRNNIRKAAVCIPSHPMEVSKLHSLGSDHLLRKWWMEWRHNIASDLGIVPHIGRLFLVTEKTDTEQFANCYYEGRDTSTDLKVTGRLPNNAAHLTLSAGFGGHDDGRFGFKWSSHLPGEKWAIFIRSEKLYLILFAKLRSSAAQLWQ